MDEEVRREERQAPVTIEIGGRAIHTDCIVGTRGSELLIGHIVLVADSDAGACRALASLRRIPAMTAQVPSVSITRLHARRAGV